MSRQKTGFQVLLMPALVPDSIAIADTFPDHPHDEICIITGLVYPGAIAKQDVRKGKLFVAPSAF